MFEQVVFKSFLFKCLEMLFSLEFGIQKCDVERFYYMVGSGKVSVVNQEILCFNVLVLVGCFIGILILGLFLDDCEFF